MQEIEQASGESKRADVWRDVLPIHPAADLFPMMSQDELIELGNDIKANGLRVPIVIWSKTGDSKSFLLDGRNRLAAMEAIGIRFADENWKGGGIHQLVVNYSCLFGSGGGYRFDGTSSTADPYEYVLSANLLRRHLTAEQRRELIAKVLKAKPETSNLQIAKQVKVSDKTVAKVRTELETTSEIPKLDKTVGLDGKRRPARKAITKPTPEPSTSTSTSTSTLKPAPKASQEDVTKAIEAMKRSWRETLAVFRAFNNRTRLKAALEIHLKKTERCLKALNGFK